MGGTPDVWENAGELFCEGKASTAKASPVKASTAKSSPVKSSPVKASPAKASPAKAPSPKASPKNRHCFGRDCGDGGYNSCVCDCMCCHNANVA